MRVSTSWSFTTYKTNPTKPKSAWNQIDFAQTFVTLFKFGSDSKVCLFSIWLVCVYFSSGCCVSTFHLEGVYHLPSIWGVCSYCTFQLGGVLCVGTLHMGGACLPSIRMVCVYLPSGWCVFICHLDDVCLSSIWMMCVYRPSGWCVLIFHKDDVCLSSIRKTCVYLP